VTTRAEFFARIRASFARSRRCSPRRPRPGRSTRRPRDAIRRELAERWPRPRSVPPRVRARGRGVSTASVPRRRRPDDRPNRPASARPGAGEAARRVRRRRRAAARPHQRAGLGVHEIAGRRGGRLARARAAPGDHRPRRSRLTGVDLAVAETGTLVSCRRRRRARRRCCALPHRPAIAPRSSNRFLRSACFSRPGTETARRPPMAPFVNFITGPSRTADIELTLTRGVHGPRKCTRSSWTGVFVAERHFTAADVGSAHPKAYPDHGNG